MRVLVISPHPDDDVFGCGGMIRNHHDWGGHVTVLYLSSGEKGASDVAPDELGPMREWEAQEAGIILGVDVQHFLRMPDGEVNAWALRDRFLNVLKETGPYDRIYAPHPEESHPDHRAGGWLAGLALVDRFPPEVWLYEVWTPIQKPDFFADITDVIGYKIQAMRKHWSQTDRVRFDEAMIALNKYRGILHNRPHGDYAEAYARMVL